MKQLIASLALALALNDFTLGQTINTAKLDSLFDALATRNLAMGSLTIAINGQVLYQKAIGFASIDQNKKIAANIDTKYRVGSVSKLFTAVMIFQLIDEGKLKLNQKLATYFPSLPNADKITISHLLNHRSGLPNYSEGTNYADWMDKPKTHDQMLQIIAGRGIDFEPNSRAEYANTNYLLLGYIIEKVTKTSYQQALKARILAKVNLAKTQYISAIKTDKNESASYKYVETKWKREPETHASIHNGAGSIVSTPTDMVKFINALFTNQLVTKSSLDRMTTMIDGYGMGLFPYESNSRRGYGHNGRIEEFYSSLQYYPETKLAVAYCTNGILYPRVDMLKGILAICFKEPYSVPFSRSIWLTNQALTNYVGHYAADQPPIMVNCTSAPTKLFVETRGHVFEVEPINDNYFMHAPTGTFFEFMPQQGILQIKETDNVYLLKRK